ncbi:MAG: hypothetical protein U0360_01030 [Dehalococcoidia bacterium]
MSGLIVLVLGLTGACGSPAGPAAAPNPPGVGRTEAFGLTEQELASRIEAVEGSIAACMVAAGFEYVPVDVVTVKQAMSALGRAPGLSDEDYVARFGYGISTQQDNPGRATSVGDVNARLFARLSPADRVAYARTLLGDDTTATFVVSLDRENFSTTGGCTRTAVAKHFDESQLAASYINPTTVLVEQHPRMIAAQREWQTCMRTAGFDYGRQEQAEEKITQRFLAITKGADLATLQGSDRDAITALQGEERAIAAADFKCSARYVDKVEEQVEFEITGRRAR